MYDVAMVTVGLADAGEPRVPDRGARRFGGEVFPDPTGGWKNRRARRAG